MAWAVSATPNTMAIARVIVRSFFTCFLLLLEKKVSFNELSVFANNRV
jgi:hypothetical protein